MLDPQYANELIDVRKLHKIETFDTRTTINEMIPNLYDYIVEIELAGNPYTEPPPVPTEPPPPQFFQ